MTVELQVPSPSWNSNGRLERTANTLSSRSFDIVKNPGWLVCFIRKACLKTSICHYQYHMTDLIPGSRPLSLPVLVWLVDCHKKLQDRPHLLMWLAYCYFHNGDYKKAIDAYDDAMRKAQCTVFWNTGPGAPHFSKLMYTSDINPTDTAVNTNEPKSLYLILYVSLMGATHLYTVDPPQNLMLNMLCSSKVSCGRLIRFGKLA